MVLELVIAGTAQAHRSYVCGDVLLDIDARVASVAGERVILTFVEFEMVAALLADPGRAFSREELRAKLPTFPRPNARAVDTHIARLRRKLAAAERFSIETVQHFGYRCWAPGGPEAEVP